MRLPKVPPVVIGGIAALPDMFVAIATARKLPRDQAEQATAVLPEQLAQAPCFLDRITGLWRYDFGNPYDRPPDGGTVFGTHMWQPIERLFDVILCAMQLLTPEQVESCAIRLADPNKHEDMLVEFAPVLRLSPAVTANYEVEGYGEGSTTVDWLVQDGHDPSLCLDVKNRTRDLLESFIKMQRGERAPEGPAPAPTHDTGVLFRNLEEKFQPRDPKRSLQGAWITTELKQEESELRAAFAQLDRRRIHFAVLGDWDDDVYILCDDEAIRRRIAEFLRIRESRRFVFSRGEG